MDFTRFVFSNSSLSALHASKVLLEIFICLFYNVCLQYLSGGTAVRIPMHRTLCLLLLTILLFTAGCAKQNTSFSSAVISRAEELELPLQDSIAASKEDSTDSTPSSSQSTAFPSEFSSTPENPSSSSSQTSSSVSQVPVSSSQAASQSSPSSPSSPAHSSEAQQPEITESPSEKPDPPQESEESRVPESVVPEMPDDTEESEESDNPEEPEEPETDHEDDSSSQTLSITVGGKTVTGPALEIISKVVANEIGNSAHEEAIKAQAVAAYSYIRHYNSIGNSPAMALNRTPSASLISAVESVLGEAVYYNGSLALTTFFSCSPGTTASSVNVWKTRYPYLISVSSSIDLDYSNCIQTVSMSTSEVRKKLLKHFDVDLDAVSESEWFDILSYHDENYVEEIRIGGADGVITTGRIIRENVLSLRSSAFDITYNQETSCFEITTWGYGHGVGMSQIGAMLYAEEGWDYIDILTHYYPGTEVY